MKKIETLQQFYQVMMSTVNPRRKLVEDILNGGNPSEKEKEELQSTLSALEAIPESEGRYSLQIDHSGRIDLDLSYEIGELKKDVFYLEHSGKEFRGHLEGLHEDFSREFNDAKRKLTGKTFETWITDRDGTVNNYCGRYASSVQSVYNAVFLTRFARSQKGNSVILTSAPLDNIGLVDISVAPEGTFIYAGSKGREYFNRESQRCQLPIPDDKRKKIHELNQRLSDIINDPRYEKFSLIGSGLQYKFGQTTIARQDITKSIPDKESEAFLREIEGLVKEIDPREEYFRIEDTGKDIEIILTVDRQTEAGESEDFNKGDGIRFLDDDIPLQMSKGTTLICGDTHSDVPMLRVARDISRATHSVFVTRDEDLKREVRAVCPAAVIVSTPDVLVAVLNDLSFR